MPSKSQTLTVKVPSRLAARLSAGVSRRGVTQSTLIREALEAYLSESRLASPGSCLDLAVDLAGSVMGPGDLSSNRKRLDGYGQ